MCVCVRMHSESSEPTMLFSQTTPDEHPPTPPPCRWPTPSLYAPSSTFSSFGATSVMPCCSASACWSVPLRRSVRYPSTGLVVNVIHIQKNCDPVNVFHIVDGLVSFEVRLISKHDVHLIRGSVGAKALFLPIRRRI